MLWLVLLKREKALLKKQKKERLQEMLGLFYLHKKVEHYEISTYGGLAQLATTLGLTEVADLLRQTLQEEKETDKLLTQIAESGVNYEAAEEVE